MSTSYDVPEPGSMQIRRARDARWPPAPLSLGVLGESRARCARRSRRMRLCSATPCTPGVPPASTPSSELHVVAAVWGRLFICGRTPAEHAAGGLPAIPHSESTFVVAEREQELISKIRARLSTRLEPGNTPHATQQAASKSCDREVLRKNVSYMTRPPHRICQDFVYTVLSYCSSVYVKNYEVK